MRASDVRFRPHAFDHVRIVQFESRSLRTDSGWCCRRSSQDLGFDESLSESLGEAKHDEAVRRAHTASQDALGDEAGSPIIAIDGRAFFGPVLTGVPDPDDRVVLLDAVGSAAGVPEFAVLQRPHG